MNHTRIQIVASYASKDLIVRLETGNCNTTIHLDEKEAREFQKQLITELMLLGDWQTAEHD